MTDRSFYIALYHTSVYKCMVGRICINNEEFIVIGDNICVASAYGGIVAYEIIHITLFLTYTEERFIDIYLLAVFGSYKMRNHSLSWLSSTVKNGGFSGLFTAEHCSFSEIQMLTLRHNRLWSRLRSRHWR